MKEAEKHNVFPLTDTQKKIFTNLLKDGKINWSRKRKEMETSPITAFMKFINSLLNEAKTYGINGDVADSFTGTHSDLFVLNPETNKSEASASTVVSLCFMGEIGSFLEELLRILVRI